MKKYFYQKEDRMYEFYKKYLSINLADYENIGINLEISKVLLGLLIGIIAASILISWQRNSMMLLIKKLNRHNCTDTESAKTLSELGINTIGVRTLIKSSARVGRLIGRVGASEYSYEEYIALMKAKKKKDKVADVTKETNTDKTLNKKVDYSTARFYLKDSGNEEVKNILDKQRSSVLTTALMCLLLVCIYTIVLFLLPDILELINSVLGK